MIRLKAILNSQWFFPALMLYYGMFYISFGESYPFHEGLHTDGWVFASFIPDFTKSFFFDTYYVYRILPSFLVGVCLKLLSIDTSVHHIFIGFQILNIVSIVLSCYFFKRILILFKISLKNQLLAFVLFLLNFGVIKFPFYLPVMTDTFAMMLSIALLYFYLKNNAIGIVGCTLLLAFTWPMAFYQGLLLIALPISILPNTPLLKWQKNIIYGVSILYILVFTIVYIFIEKINSTVDFVMKIDRNLLPLSILVIVVFYFGFAKLFFNRTLFDIPLFFKKLNYKRVLISIGVFVTISLIVYFLNPKPIPTYSTRMILRDPILYALIKPALSIVSYFSYFGVFICLLLLFWSSFCKIVSQMGWGLVGAFGVQIILFGITPESRHLINILPWVIVLLVKSLNKYSFSNSFYIVIGLLCFAASKIWLLLNIYGETPALNLDKNGSLGFPSQILWMNVGPWMSEQMYYIQGLAALLFTGILFFILYKVELEKFPKIKLVRKF